MVAAAKRMRGLSEKLFFVARGPGSVELPKDASIQLKRIYMRLPTGTWPNKEFYFGARQFWRRELERLKYQNPSLRVEVETIRQGEKEPMYMTAEYESADKAALDSLVTEPLPKPLFKVAPLEEWMSERTQSRRSKQSEKTAQTEQQEASKVPSLFSSERLRTIGKSLGVPKPLIRGQPRLLMDEIPPLQMMPEVQQHAPDGRTTVKAQPAASPQQPQTTTAPKTVYSRTLTLPLAGMRALDIWHWLRKPQMLPFEGRKPEQNALTTPHMKLVAFKKQAALDRKRVAEEVGRIKREAAELENARAAAQRASEQVVV